VTAFRAGAAGTRG